MKKEERKKDRGKRRDKNINIAPPNHSKERREQREKCNALAGSANSNNGGESHRGIPHHVRQTGQRQHVRAKSWGSASSPPMTEKPIPVRREYIDTSSAKYKATEKAFDARVREWESADRAYQVMRREICIKGGAH